jgi:hypothetical protein
LLTHKFGPAPNLVGRVRRLRAAQRSAYTADVRAGRFGVRRGDLGDGIEKRIVFLPSVRRVRRVEAGFGAVFPLPDFLERFGAFRFTRRRLVRRKK